MIDTTDATGWTSLFNTVGVTVTSPPALVWRLFLDRAAWMATFVSRTVLSGIDGAVGCRALVRSRLGGADFERIEEILHVEPARRLIVRMQVAGSASGGHGDFRFEPTPEGCRVEASIHTWLPAAEAAGAARLHALTQARIDADFAVLRRVAEGGAAEFPDCIAFPP